MTETRNVVRILNELASEIEAGEGDWFELDACLPPMQDWVADKIRAKILEVETMVASTKVARQETRSFTVEPGQILTVSDPCYLESETADGKLVYDLGVANSGHMGWQTDELIPGEWEAFAEYVDLEEWGVRVSRSGIRQVLDNPPRIKYKIEHCQGVDAGMVGYFIGEPVLEYEETWPHPDPVLHNDPFGVMWCSESGLGDGMYDVNVGRLDSGQVVYVSTNFQLEDWS